MAHDGDTWEMVPVSQLNQVLDAVEALRGENERLRAELEEATTVRIPRRESADEYVLDVEDRLAAIAGTSWSSSVWKPTWNTCGRSAPKPSRFWARLEQPHLRRATCGPLMASVSIRGGGPGSRMGSSSVSCVVLYPISFGSNSISCCSLMTEPPGATILVVASARDMGPGADM